MQEVASALGVVRIGFAGSGRPEEKMSTPESASPVSSSVCYRHPERTSGVACQRCGRTICGECMHQASVGVHCPECVSGTAQRVYTPRTLPDSQGVVTRVLVGANVAIWVLSLAALGSNMNDAGSVFADYGTWGRAIDLNGEWWRLVSGGFLHSGLIHIGFNMYLLWMLGRQLERVMGPTPYALTYGVALLGGSFGAVLLSPNSTAVGASGAVFGLIGVTVMLYRSRGIGLFDTGLGGLIAINVLLSFRGGISLGGHLGGLFVGLLLGVIFFGIDRRGSPLGRNLRLQLGVVGALGSLLFVGGIWAASTWSAPLF
jgi:membrane associated rhomboid family serine protease